MFGSMGGLEILLFLVFGIGIPVWALRWVAGQRGQSERFALWGLLSYLGLIVGLLMMLAVPAKTRES